MRSSTRDLLFGVALGAVALSALGAGGVAVALRQLSLAQGQALTRAQESAAALVADTQAALRREARLLARDPALVDGVAKGDWGTLARGVSPRLAAVTLERVADFISVLDASGSALLQVPALPPTPVSDPAAISAAPPGLTDLGGHPFVVVAVPVVGPGAGNAGEVRPAGFVVIARRLESLAAPAAGASARPGILFLVNGRPLVSSLQRPPTTDWIGATVAGKVRLDGGRDFLVRPADQVAVSGPGRLWLLVADEGQGRRRALVGWLTGLGVCGLGGAAAALLLYRDRRASGWELARAVRETAPSLPVILVTGFAVEVSAEELRASGVHSVLAKPVNVGELLDAAAAIRPRGEREDERP